MKKIYLTFLGIFITAALFSQAFISEDFSGDDFPPDGWVALPLGDIWTQSNTSNAGGNTPEAKFSGSSGPGTARLISPAVDLTNVDTVIVLFKHYYADLPAPGPTIGVATRAGGSWNSVWDETPTTTVGPEEVQLVLTGGDVGAYNFQLSFYLTGSLPNLSAWYIDDVVMKSPAGLDAKMTQVTTPAVITGPDTVGGIITNLGNTVITELDVSWESYGGSIYDSVFSGLSIGLLETFEFEFDGMWVSAFGYHDLKMWINSVNGGQDEDQTNDTISKTIAYYANILDRTPCFEEFTSSTCGPCASFNSGFVPWSQQHEDEIVLIKYQMNWPGSGDPYYTAEGGVRRNYYGVSYVPDLFCNGSRVNTNMGSVQAAFDAASQLTATVDIASSFEVTGDNISITTNILPFSNYGTVKVHNILFEKVTTGNVGSNGETEFHHVMMKMFPDANGATIDLQDRESVTQTFTYNLSNTNVEQTGDLMIAVLIQDQSSKEILQSEYGYDGVTYSSEARLEMIFLDGVPLEGFDPDVYEYNVVLPAGTVEEPVLTVETVDEEALPVINQAFELPGSATIDVYAEDLSSTKRYIINYTGFVGLEEEPVSSVQVFPNPTTGQLYISGTEKAKVSLFSTDGKLIMEMENYSGNALNLSDLKRGIYILNIQTDKANMIRKKIIIM